jgi:hypothetical protein
VCGGEYGRAIDVLSQCAARLSGTRAYERFGLPYTPACTVLAWLGWALADVGRTADADAAVARIGEVAAVTQDAFSNTVSQLAPGIVLVRSGRAAAAVPVLSAALASCVSDGIYLLLPYAAGHLGWALAATGRAPQGAALLQDVITQAKARRFVAYLSRWVSMRGEALAAIGDIDGAADAAHEAIELADRYGERSNRAWAEALAATVAAARRDAAAAARHREMAHRIATDLDMRPLLDRLQPDVTAGVNGAGM